MPPGTGPVVLVMEQPSSFQSHLTAGLGAALEEVAIPLVVQLWGEDTDGTPGSLPMILELMDPRAIVVNPLTRGNAQQQLNQLLERHPHVPVIHLCSRSPKGISIRSDNAHGMRLIAEHLVSECDARRVLVVRGIDHHVDSREREETIVAELARLGRPVDSDHVVTGGFERELAQREVRAALDRDPAIDAVVAFNDRSALGAIEAILSSGRRIPEDVVITGFDDEDFGAFCHPSLTSVAQNLFGMGYAAGELIPRILTGERPGDQLLPVRLERRDSTRRSAGAQAAAPTLTAAGGDAAPKARRMWNQLSSLDAGLVLSRRFITCRTLDQTIDELCVSLPMIGITRAFMVMRSDDDPETGVLSLAYHDGARQDGLRGTRFPLAQVLPQELRHHFERGLLIMQPLQVDGDELGYLVMDQALHQVSYSAQMLAMGLSHTVDIIRRTANLAERTQELELEVASRRAAQQALVYQANHDPLTGLANPGAFRRTAERLLSGGGVTDAAMLVVEVERFKDVNDALGHSVGDALLCRIAERLAAVVGPEGVVCRMGSDEFAVLAPGASDADEALHLARKVEAGLRRQYAVNGVTLEVEFSIGVAVCPTHARDAESLLRMADLAMYTAKAAHTGAALYDPREHQSVPRRLALFGELRRALTERELVIHYQPVVDVSRGRTSGVEALVRWQHPTQGLLPPSEFIELAEQTALIHDLTTYVLDQALRDCRQWLDEGLDLVTAVNLSTRRLMDADLPGEVSGLLDRHGLPSSRLVLEVTETAAMTDPERSMAVLRELRALGIHLSVDDYGTGHASLAYLSRLPVTALKIDRSFVMSMESEHANDTIVRSTLQLAEGLGMRVIAEGVETASAYRRLRSFGCGEAQGYWLGKPCPAHEIPLLVDDLHRRLAEESGRAVPRPRARRSAGDAVR